MIKKEDGEVAGGKGHPVCHEPTQEGQECVGGVRRAWGDTKAYPETDAYKLEEVGVLRTAISLCRTGHDIRYQQVCRIMKKNGLAVPSDAKSRKRKWVRYERKYSNSMWPPTDTP